MTLGGVLRYCAARVRVWVRTKLSVACPNCRSLIAPFQAACAGCGSTLSVGSTLEHTFAPFRSRFQTLALQTRSKAILFQWSYLLLSAGLFWAILAVLEKRFAEDWLNRAMLSVIYLAVFLLLSLWLVPQRTLTIIAERASKLTKLALVFNYLTALFLFQMFVATWWTRSLMLGVLFMSTWAGAWVFWRYLWPMSTIVSDVFMPKTQPFDPAAAQGRTVRLD